MNSYELVSYARAMAQRNWIGGPVQRLLCTLADELEMSVTKLRDKEWAHEWAVKQKRAKELEYFRKKGAERRARLRKQKKCA